MNPNLPVGGSAIDLQLGAKRALPENLTQLGIASAYSHYGETYRGSTRADDRSLSLDILLTTLSARHHFGEGWSADVALPTGSIWLHPGGGEPTLTLNGFGDLELGVSYDFAALWGVGAYRPSLRWRQGVGLPTGRASTVEDPASEAPPSVLSLGLATYSVITELTWTQFLTPSIAVMAPLSVRQPLGRTETGKEYGTIARYGGAVLVVPTRNLVLSAGVEHQVRGHITDREEGRLLNSGSTVTRGVVNGSWRLSDLFTLQAGAGRPLRVDVEGQQISESFTVTAGLSLNFAGSEDAHAHGGHDDHGHDDHDEHGHGADHDGNANGHSHERESSDSYGDGGAHARGPHAHGSGDFRDLATGGRSFALANAAVPGKITVIDFWADWCEPCEHIGATLRHLAAMHPNLAVRKVEIVDDDSPAAREHLKGKVALPEVWILDTSGRRLHTLRATSDARVRAALQPLLEGQPSKK